MQWKHKGPVRTTLSDVCGVAEDDQQTRYTPSFRPTIVDQNLQLTHPGHPRGVHVAMVFQKQHTEEQNVGEEVVDCAFTHAPSGSSNSCSFHK